MYPEWEDEYEKPGNELRRGAVVTDNVQYDDENPGAPGNAHGSVFPAEYGDAFRDRCKADRGSLSPRETADRAGAELAELYENEEDGGS